MATVETALTRSRRSSSVGSSSTAAAHNRSEYGATAFSAPRVTSPDVAACDGRKGSSNSSSSISNNNEAGRNATGEADGDNGRRGFMYSGYFSLPSTPRAPSSMLSSAAASALKSNKRRPLPLKQRTSSVDTRRDVTAHTWRSLLVLIKPREYFVTVDHFSIWRRHLAWAMENGKDLRTYMTQRYASNMVFMSLLLSTELGVLFNSAPLNTNVRLQLQAGNHSSVEFWAGFMILVSALLTILGLFSTFTAWSMVNSVDEHNSHCIFRSSIGQYAAELPGRFIVCSIYSFLLSLWLFFFLLLPFGIWSMSLLTVSILLFVHVVAAFSAFGRIIMHTGAMGRMPIFEHSFEQSLLPHTLHANLLNKAKANLAHNTSITRQYRKKQAPIDRPYSSQEDLYHHLSQYNRTAYNRASTDSYSSCRSTSSNASSNLGTTPLSHSNSNNNNNNTGRTDDEAPYRRRADSLVRFADEEQGYATGVGLVQNIPASFSPPHLDTDTIGHTYDSSKTKVTGSPDKDGTEKSVMTTRLKPALANKSSTCETPDHRDRRDVGESPHSMLTGKTKNLTHSSPPPLLQTSLPSQVSRGRSLTTDVSSNSQPGATRRTGGASATAHSNGSSIPRPPLPSPFASTVSNVSSSSLEQWLQSSGGSNASTPANSNSSENRRDGAGKSFSTRQRGLDYSVVAASAVGTTSSATARNSSLSLLPSSHDRVSQSDADASGTGKYRDGERSSPPLPMKEVHTTSTNSRGSPARSMSSACHPDQALNRTGGNLASPFDLQHRESDLSSMDGVESFVNVNYDMHDDNDDDDDDNDNGDDRNYERTIAMPTKNHGLPRSARPPTPNTLKDRLWRHGGATVTGTGRVQRPHRPDRHHSRNPSLISLSVDTRDMSEEERFLMDYGDFESPYGVPSVAGVSPSSYYNLQTPSPRQFAYEEENEDGDDGDDHDEEQRLLESEK